MSSDLAIVMPDNPHWWARVRLKPDTEIPPEHADWLAYDQVYNVVPVQKPPLWSVPLLNQIERLRIAGGTAAVVNPAQDRFAVFPLSALEPV